MKTDYIAKTIQAYDNNPQKYIDKTQDMILHSEIEKFLKQIPNGGLILDGGCAFGRDARIFYSKGYKVIGIDLSEKLLEKAKELSPQIDYRLMDLRKLEFSDETFDGVWCSASLLHLNHDDLKVSLKEIFSILKKNGVLYCSFKKGEENKEVLESFSSDKPRFFNYITQDKLKSLLREAGFKIEEIFEVNEREKFGPDKRDLVWISAFSKK